MIVHKIEGIHQPHCNSRCVGDYHYLTPRMTESVSGPHIDLSYGHHQVDGFTEDAPQCDDVQGGNP